MRIMGKTYLMAKMTVVWLTNTIQYEYGYMAVLLPCIKVSLR
jgi:hypothetical protein